MPRRPNADPARSARQIKWLAKAKAACRFLRTPDREVFMRENYATFTDEVAFLRDLNAMQGPQFTSMRQVRQLAAKMGLHRAKATPKPRKCWTPERLALLRDLYPSPLMLISDIITRLHELPGPPIGGVTSKNVTLSVLKEAQRQNLRRSPMGESLARSIGQLKRRNNGQVPSYAELAARRKVERKARAEPCWPEARVARLRELYPSADVTIHEILAALNAIEGQPLSSIHSVRKKARKLGLKRPMEAIQAQNGQRERERAAAIPKPVPAPKPKAPPMAKPIPRPAQRFEFVPSTPPTPVVFTSPEIADAAVISKNERAKDMLRRKITEERVRIETQLPLREIFRLKAEVRREGMAA